MYIHISLGHVISHYRGKKDTKLLETRDTLKLMWIIKVEEFANHDIQIFSEKAQKKIRKEAIRKSVDVLY